MSGDEKRYTAKDLDEAISLARVVEARHALAIALRRQRRLGSSGGAMYWAGAIDATVEAVEVARRRVKRLEKQWSRKRGGA